MYPVVIRGSGENFLEGRCGCCRACGLLLCELGSRAAEMKAGPKAARERWRWQRSGLRLLVGWQRQRLPDQDRGRKASTQRERQRWQRVFADSSQFFLSWEGWWRPVAPVAGVGLLPCFIAKRGASAADALAVPPRGRPVSAKAAFQRVPAARSARQVRRQHPESRGDLF